MRITLPLAFLWMAVLAPFAAAQPYATPGPQTQAPYAGQLPAQTSTGSATAGSIGEFASVLIPGGASPCAGSASYTNANPAVITCAGNTFAADCVSTGLKCTEGVYFTGFVGGNGISNSTTYYVASDTISGNTFKIATNLANAANGVYVATTGSEGAVGTMIEGTLIATSNTAIFVGALYLTPGDWDCSGVLVTTGVASTAPTVIKADINSGGVTDGSSTQFSLPFTTGAVANAVPVLPKRVSLSTQTNVGIRMTETWTGGATNPVVSGRYRCRRAG